MQLGPILKYVGTIHYLVIVTPLGLVVCYKQLLVSEFVLNFRSTEHKYGILALKL